MMTYLREVLFQLAMVHYNGNIFERFVIVVLILWLSYIETKCQLSSLPHSDDFDIPGCDKTTEVYK